MVDGVFYLPDPSPQVLAERVERAEEQAEEVLIQDNLKRIREEEENAQLDQEQQIYQQNYQNFLRARAEREAAEQGLDEEDLDEILFEEENEANLRAIYEDEFSSESFFDSEYSSE